jgi:hypothetical protein
MGIQEYHIPNHQLVIASFIFNSTNMSSGAIKYHYPTVLTVVPAIPESLAPRLGIIFGSENTWLSTRARGIDN